MEVGIVGVLGFILYLVVAAICAVIAERIVPGRIPGGFLVAAIFGILGAWIGTSLMGSVGPVLEGVPILPAIIGSAVVIFLLTFFSRGAHGVHR